MKVYLANDLFNEATLAYNKVVAKFIRDKVEDVDLFVPQEDESINDKTQYADSIAIAKSDTKHLLESDVLVAILDGQVIDVGVASEIGMFYMTGKPIIGVYTDTRQVAYGNQEKKDAMDIPGESQVSYINLFTVGLVKQNGVIFNTYKDVPELLNRIKQKLGE